MDLVNRKGGEHLEFWELQERGAWHVHCLTNIYLDVNWLRPWMVARGWGPIMKVKRADQTGSGLVSYLSKYLTKCFRNTSTRFKKGFGGSRPAKAGTTNFKWAPHIRPGAYLFAAGVSLFISFQGHFPRFRDIGQVIRMGVEETQWLEIDPWYLDTC